MPSIDLKDLRDELEAEKGARVVREGPFESPGDTFWATVREAIRGTKQDLTAIPISRAIVLLAIPTVLEMSMESLLTVVDIACVSRLGDRATATVGLTESILSIIYALAMGLAAAATATISRRVGEKDARAAAVAAAQVILLSLLCSVVLGAIGATFAPRLLTLVGAEPDVVAHGSGYATIMIGGNVTIFLIFVINACLRGAGDAATAMRALWLANVLNMLLAPCLVFGMGPFPRLGVVGAAIATTASRAAGVTYQLVALVRGRDLLPIAVRYLVPRVRLMADLLRIASSATFQVLIETASWLGLVRILSGFGSAALAGYTIAMRIAIFALLPSWGLAGATATLVGQNLGARRPERAEASVRAIARLNVGFLLFIGGGFAICATSVLSLLSTNPETIAYGAACLRTVAVGFVFFGFGMVTVQAFNGAGDTLTPMLVNICAFWLFKIPLAFVLANGFHLGPRGVFFAITAAYALQSIVAGLLFRRGRWKEQKLPMDLPTPAPPA